MDILVKGDKSTTKRSMEIGSCSTSGWGLWVGGDRTGGTDETPEFKGNEVCTDGDVDVTETEVS